jgi:DNA-binding MurR/RpiR family transcriptional regulator
MTNWHAFKYTKQLRYSHASNPIPTALVLCKDYDDSTQGNMLVVQQIAQLVSANTNLTKASLNNALEKIVAKNRVRVVVLRDVVLVNQLIKFEVLKSGVSS